MPLDRMESRRHRREPRLRVGARPRLDRSSGFALVLVLFMLAGATAIAIALFANSTRNTHGVSGQRLRLTCLSVANSRSTEATLRLGPTAKSFYSNHSFFSTSAQSVMSGSVTVGTVPFAFASTVQGADSTGLSDVTAQNVVVRTSVTGPNQTGCAVRLDAQAQGKSPWDRALCACRDLTTNSVVTSDSYDSRNGTYISQVPSSMGGFGANRDATIGGGSTTVNGDAIAGGQMSGSGTVTGVKQSGGSNSMTGGTGSVSPTPAPCDCSSIDLATEMTYMSTHNDNSSMGGCQSFLSGTSLSVGGLTLGCTLPAGSYYLTSLSISSLATVTIGGNVKLYLAGSGPWSIGAGGFSNSSSNTARLRIFSNTTSNLTIGGSSNTAALVYAPSATLTMSDTRYGSYVAYDIRNSGNATVHYDVYAKSIPATVKDVAATSWSSGS